jgi:hypothetical protein
MIMLTTKEWLSSQVPTAHACNPSYSGGRAHEDHVLKPHPNKYFVKPYLENT